MLLVDVSKAVRKESAVSSGMIDATVYDEWISRMAWIHYLVRLNMSAAKAWPGASGDGVDDCVNISLGTCFRAVHWLQLSTTD